MSEQMDSVRRRAHINPNIPPSIASLLIALANQVDDQAKLVEDLGKTMNTQHQRHENQVILLRREIDGLKGVHGAKR